MKTMMNTMINYPYIRTYSELILLPTFEDRFRYLKLEANVGDATFGFDRYLNQQFYRSSEWKRLRNEIILRDNACDLGIPDRELDKRIIDSNDGKSSTIPKGYKFNRVGQANMDINSAGALYVSSGKADATRYMRALGPT